MSVKIRDALFELGIVIVLIAYMTIAAFWIDASYFSERASAVSAVIKKS